MFWNKKPPETAGGVKPPWENIDDVPKLQHICAKRADLAEYVGHITGFGKWPSRFLLVGFALAIGFVAYAFFTNAQRGEPLPPNVDRPAMDQWASTTIQRIATSTP